MAYTTTALVKASLGIPSGTTSEDTYIAAAISAAEDEIDKYCGRTFEPAGAVSARVYQPSTNVLAYTDDFFTLTGLVVKQDDSNDGTYGTTLTITTDFIVVGNSAPFNTIRSVSSPFPLGVMAGVVNDFGPMRVSRVDPDYRALLSGYRRIGVA